MNHLLLIVAGIVPCVFGMPDYAAKIPHGFRVPHPCYPQADWKGVGHKNYAGGGALNPFGEDFRENNYKWDSCLCETDSDGDGRTNGEELGDPYCLWREGDEIEITEDISHPGVCEPIDSPACVDKNNWEVCASLDMACPGAEDPATEQVIFRFPEDPPTVVPQNETNYYCMAVEFDKNITQHAFGMTAVVDNEFLTHHIDLNACENKEASDDAWEHFSVPRPCDAMGLKCNTLVAAWAVGLNGICLPEKVGIRVGKTGFRTAILRIHYHNPFGRVGETDTSGLRLLVTPELREYSASVINLGQSYLEIPPGQPSFDAHVFCEPFCTQHLTQNINVVFATMHMHYLGTGGHAELWRDGRYIQDIMVQDFYDYNSPHIQVIDPPLVIRPNDTIKHVCHFQSMDRTEVTWRGQSASDEMCHLYLVHYPAQPMTSCGPDGNTGSCRFLAAGKIRDYKSQGCDYDDFKHHYNAYIKDSLMSVCDIEGKECREGCPEMLDWALSNHSCLAGEAKYSCFRRNDELMYMQSSCKDYPAPQTPAPISTPEPGVCLLPPGGETGAGTKLQVIGVISWVLVILLHWM